MSHDDAALRVKVQRLVDELFTNGQGETADRLVLIRDGRDLGGWCRGAIVDRVMAVLASGVPSTPNRLPQWIQTWLETTVRPCPCSVEIQELFEASGVPSTPCRWVEDDEGIWETACGERWVFTEGYPWDNKARFCFACGSRIDATPYVDPPLGGDGPEEATDGV